MGILDKIFARFFHKQVRPGTTALVNEASFTSLYSPMCAYDNDIFREAVDAIARNAAKLKGIHVISSEVTPPEDKLNALLQLRPNPFMSAYDFLYKVASRLFIHNNSFVYIERENGQVKALYPITATQVDIKIDPDGNLYCGFTLRDGRDVTLPYSDIIHLRRFFSENDVLGPDNCAISAGVELAQTQNDGITQAIKTGAHIRGLLTFKNVLNADDLKRIKDDFMADYLSMSNDGGVIAIDDKIDYQPIDHKPVVLDADQDKEVKTKIYDYLGISEAIVNSSYTEDQYSAFYESVLEPFAVALSQEFTQKLFTDQERRFGNSVIFEAGRLQFTSNKTKVNLISQLAPYGLLTINQCLEILNLPRVEDGDKRLQALNMIDQRYATSYQMDQLRRASDDERNSSSGNSGE